MLKLSIITINYNNAEGLEKTIKSVVDQTFLSYEVIIIDGGSNDRSIDIIKSYSDKIGYWVSEKDSGIYNAQNKGLRVAKGEYCLFLNSGDFLVNKKVLNKVFSGNYTEDILYGNMLINWGGGKIKLGRMPSEVSLYQMYTDTLWHPVSFIKRQLFEKYGNYNESYKMVADYDFFFRMIVVHKVSLRHFSFPVSEFNVNGLSSKPENKIIEQKERRNVIKTYLSETEISALEQQVKIEALKKSTFFKRLINKIKCL